MRASSPFAVTAPMAPPFTQTSFFKVSAVGAAGLLLAVATSVHAVHLLSPQEAQNAADATPSILSTFRFYQNVELLAPPLKVPTVVEVPLSSSVLLGRPMFAVLNLRTNTFEPYYYRETATVQKTSVTLSTAPATRARTMNYGDPASYAEFLLPENAEGMAGIILYAERPLTSSRLTLLLDNNVALPTSVAVRARVKGEDRIVVGQRSMTRRSIQFPQTTSDHWEITFTYSQPLRITELRLQQEGYGWQRER